MVSPRHRAYLMVVGLLLGTLTAVSPVAVAQVTSDSEILSKLNTTLENQVLLNQRLDALTVTISALFATQNQTRDTVDATLPVIFTQGQVNGAATGGLNATLLHYVDGLRVSLSGVDANASARALTVEERFARLETMVTEGNAKLTLIQNRLAALNLTTLLMNISALDSRILTHDQQSLLEHTIVNSGVSAPDGSKYILKVIDDQHQLGENQVQLQSTTTSDAQGMSGRLSSVESSQARIEGGMGAIQTLLLLITIGLALWKGPPLLKMVQRDGRFPLLRKKPAPIEGPKLGRVTAEGQPGAELTEAQRQALAPTKPGDGNGNGHAPPMPPPDWLDNALHAAEQPTVKHLRRARRLPTPTGGDE